jgi:hypothetical protein
MNSPASIKNERFEEFQSRDPDGEPIALAAEFE